MAEDRYAEGRRAGLEEAARLVKPTEAFEILIARQIESQGSDGAKTAAHDSFVRMSLASVLRREFSEVEKAIRRAVHPDSPEGGAA